jgi:hypothetical protein
MQAKERRDKALGSSFVTRPLRKIQRVAAAMLQPVVA